MLCFQYVRNKTSNSMFGLEQSHSGHFDAVVISHRSLVVPAILLHDLRALCFRVTYIIHSNDPFAALLR